MSLNSQTITILEQNQEQEQEQYSPDVINKERLIKEEMEKIQQQEKIDSNKTLEQKSKELYEVFDKNRWDGIKSNLSLFSNILLDDLFNNIITKLYLLNKETSRDLNLYGGNICNGNIFDLDINADELWNKIDTDSSGDISKQELNEILKDFGLNKDNIDELFKDIDSDGNGDGKIDKNEFKKWLYSSGVISSRLKQINNQNYDDFKNLQRLKFHMDRIHDFKGNHGFKNNVEKTIKDTYSSFLRFHNNKVASSDLKAFFDDTFTKYNSIDKKHEEHFYFSQIMTLLQNNCNLINDLIIYKYSSSESIISSADDKFKINFTEWSGPDAGKEKDYFISDIENNELPSKIFDEDNVAFSFEDNSISQKIVYPLVNKDIPGKLVVSKEELEKYETNIKNNKINTISSFLDPAWTSKTFNTLSLGINDINQYKNLTPLEKQKYKILETQNFNHKYSYYAIDLFKDSIQNFFDYHDAKLKIDFDKNDLEHNNLINECITYLNYLENDNGTKDGENIPNIPYTKVSEQEYPIYFSDDNSTINIKVKNYKAGQPISNNIIKLKAGDTTIDSIYNYVKNSQFNFDSDPDGWTSGSKEDKEKYSRLYNFGRIIFDSIVKTDLFSDGSFREKSGIVDNSPAGFTWEEDENTRLFAYIVITFKALGDSMQVNYNKRLNNFVQQKLLPFKNNIAIKTTDKNVIAECFLINQSVWSTNSGLTSHIDWINNFKLPDNNQLDLNETNNYKLLITNYPMNNTVLYYNNLSKTLSKIKNYMNKYNKSKFNIDYEGDDIEIVPNLEKDAVVSDADIEKIKNNKLIKYLGDLNQQKSDNGIFNSDGYNQFVSIVKKYEEQGGGYRQTMFPKTMKKDADYIINFFKTTFGTSKADEWVEWSINNLGLTFPPLSATANLPTQKVTEWLAAIQQYETKNNEDDDDDDDEGEDEDEDEDEDAAPPADSPASPATASPTSVTGIEDEEWLTYDQIPFQPYDGSEDDKNKNYLFELNRFLNKIINIYEKLCDDISSCNKIIDSYSTNLINYISDIENMFFTGSYKTGNVEAHYNKSTFDLIYDKFDIKFKNKIITNLSINQIKIEDPNNEGKFKFYEDGDTIPEEGEKIQFRERMIEQSLTPEIYVSIKNKLKLIMKDLEIYNIFNLLNGDIINFNDKINEEYNNEKAAFSYKMKQLLNELERIVYPEAAEVRVGRKKKAANYGKYDKYIESINEAYSSIDFDEILDKISEFVDDILTKEEEIIKKSKKKISFCDFLKNLVLNINELKTNIFLINEFKDSEDSVNNANSIITIIDVCQKKIKKNEYAIFYNKEFKEKSNKILSDISNFSFVINKFKAKFLSYLAEKDKNLPSDKIGEQLPKDVSKIAKELIEQSNVASGIDRKTKKKPKKKPSTKKKPKKKPSTKKKSTAKKKSSTKKKPKKKSSTKKKPKKKPSTKKKPKKKSK